MVEMNEAIEIVQEVLENNKIDFPKKYIEDLASAYIRRDLSDDELNELVAVALAAGCESVTREIQITVSILYAKVKGPEK